MAPELKTPDLDDQDLLAAFAAQSPLQLEDDERDDEPLTGDELLDRQIFAQLVTP